MLSRVLSLSKDRTERSPLAVAGFGIPPWSAGPQIRRRRGSRRQLGGPRSDPAGRSNLREGVCLNLDSVAWKCYHCLAVFHAETYTSPTAWNAVTSSSPMSLFPLIW